MIKSLKGYLILYCVTAVISMILFTVALCQGIAIFVDTYYFSSNNLSIVGQNSVKVQGIVMALTLFIIALVIFILSIIFSMILLYYFWESIKDGSSTRISPGKAVGFMFIPFFNLYWSFQAYVGLSADMKSYLEENKISARAPSNLVGGGIVILSVFLVFSAKGVIILLWISIILNMLFLFQGYSAVKAIYEAEDR
ncbi:MAG: hypothetical protein NTX05_00115 [Fusobacteria bacterium]|nr:hypothetical protein [Fusobacteriota bacterium]